MTGKEIAEICARNENCENCEARGTSLCGAVVRNMSVGIPSTILEILEKEYGGGEE